MTSPHDTHEINIHIGARLRAARRQKHLTKEQLAHRLGVSREDIASYEAGEHLSPARLFRLARALDTSVSHFYDGLHGVNACHCSLSDERLLLFRRALERIAANHEVTPGGHRKRIARSEAVSIARAVCEKMGWTYSGKHKRAAAE